MAIRKAEKVIQLRRDTRPLDARIDEYLADARAEGLLSKTVKFYEAVLRKQKGSLLDYCKDQGVSQLPKIDADFLQGWKTWLHERPAYPMHPGDEPRTGQLSKQTKATYVRTVKTFLKWAKKEGYAPNVPDLDEVKVPKVPEEPYDVLTKRRG